MLPVLKRTVAGIAITAICAASCLVAAAQEDEPVVTTSPDAKSEGLRVRASINIPAPPDVVWNVVADCVRTPKIIPHFESCKVIDKDPAGQWDVRENVVNPPLLPRIHTVMRNTFDRAKKLSFKLVRGDMRKSEGEWRFEPSGKGTKLSYDAVMAPNFMAPQFLVAQAVKNDFPTALRAIRRASIEDAAAKR